MKRFYEVTSEGNIIRRDLYEGDCYCGTAITSRTADDHCIVDDSKPTAKGGLARLFTAEAIDAGVKAGKLFFTLEDAMAKSAPLWDAFFGPNDKWQVIGVFDNVEVVYRSEPMGKAEAKAALEECCDSIYTKYSIHKVK